MTDGLLVGLDVGTTTSKAVVFDQLGRPVGQGRADTPWVVSQAGVELDSQRLAAAARQALTAALTDAPVGPILGIGVASMGESGVLLDRAGLPAAPVIAWHDTRDSLELADLQASIDADAFAEATGLPLRAQWSLTKHRWLLAHHPAAKAAVRRLNIAEFIVHTLGGEQACEMSLASRTGWLELTARDWWSQSLDWSGAPASLMPELVGAGTNLGRVNGAAGIDRLTGATITVAGHDHQAAAIGAGAAVDGDELDSCGTAEALIRTISPGLTGEVIRSLTDAGITVGWHAMPGKWCLLGATTGGLTLQRVLAALGKGRADLPALDAAATELPATAVRITETPDGVAILDIQDGITPGHIWRAALDSVTDDAGRLHDQISAVTGQHHNLVVTGGWANSQGLLAVKNRRLGILRHPDVDEAGARGAALLAGLAAGVYAGSDDFPSLS